MCAVKGGPPERGVPIACSPWWLSSIKAEPVLKGHRYILHQDLPWFLLGRLLNSSRGDLILAKKKSTKVLSWGFKSLRLMESYEDSPNCGL